MLKNPLFRKLLVIACIVFLLSLVLVWIKGLVREREGFQREAVQKIAQSHAGQQILTGPIMVIPYTEHYTVDIFLGKEKAHKEQILLVFPLKTETQGKFEVHTRSVGIHDVRVYGLKGSMTGQFPSVSASEFRKTENNSDITIGQPRIILGLSDIRGFHSTPKLVLEQTTLLAQPGTEHAVIAKGVHFDMPMHTTLDKPQAFTLSLDLIGMEQFSLVPIANDNFVKFDSPWAHPSFGGDFLPRADQKVVNDQGFSAGWSVPSLATHVQTQIRKANQPNVHLQTISLGFIEPINIYSLGWRASEYGLLFVLAAFVTFFLFETLKRLRIHPVQYTLVGLAQAVFFLLLLALSEQIAFMWAYTGAATACLALLTLYLSHVLQSIWRALGAAGVFAGLYVLLYQILNSEDKAFLMGAILVFAGLAATMLVTRKVNWFELSKVE